MRISIFLFAIIAVLFTVLYSMLCVDGIYQSSFGKAAANWTRENDTPVQKHVPMTRLTNENVVQWDAVHYERISKKGYEYDKSGAGNDYIFAFFPMFPILWKVLFLPPIGVMILNYILFAGAFLILLRLFASYNKPYWLQILLAWSLPSIIIFLIPYSEATFMLMVSIGLYGMVRNKYWIYFIGFFLAALCRPAYTFLFLSIFCIEILRLLGHRSFLNFIKSIFLKTLPLVLGTLTVGFIQWLEHGESLFKFIEVQKYWNNFLQMPKKLNDWSLEGFAINLGVSYVIAIPLLLFILFYGLKRIVRFFKRQEMADLSIKDYVVLLSIIFTVGSFLFIVFFRGGSLHCLFRFVICTPFFFILFIHGFEKISHIRWSYRVLALAIPWSIAALTLHKSEYSGYWNFSDFGLFVLGAVIFFWIMQDFYKGKLYRIGLVLTVVANLFWTAYLLNMYVNNGWIFA